VQVELSLLQSLFRRIRIELKSFQFPAVVAGW